MKSQMTADSDDANVMQASIDWLGQRKAEQDEMTASAQSMYDAELAVRTLQKEEEAFQQDMEAAQTKVDGMWRQIEQTRDEMWRAEEEYNNMNGVATEEERMAKEAELATIRERVRTKEDEANKE